VRYAAISPNAGGFAGSQGGIDQGSDIGRDCRIGKDLSEVFAG
jgi:hypothetical protein